MMKSNFSSEEIQEHFAEETSHEPTASELQRDGLTLRQEAEVPPGVHLPTNGGFAGEDSIDAKKGDTDFYSDDLKAYTITNGEPVPFKGGYPDFSNWTKARVDIPVTGDNPSDQKAAKLALGEQMARENPDGGFLKPDGSVNQSAVSRELKKEDLILHHEPSLDPDVKPTGMVAVPKDLHAIHHSGGASQMRNWTVPSADASPPTAKDLSPEPASTTQQPIPDEQLVGEVAEDTTFTPSDDAPFTPSDDAPFTPSDDAPFTPSTDFHLLPPSNRMRSYSVQAPRYLAVTA